MGLLLGPLSCTEKIEWDLGFVEEDLMVVEGKITNELRHHEVRVTRPVYELNGNPEPVRGLDMDIFDGRVVYPMVEDPSRPGIYMTTDSIAGIVERGYQLRIRTGDRRITAVSFMRAVSPFQQMRLIRVQEQPALFELRIQESDDASIVRLELDWSHVPGYDTLPDSENHALIYHYTLGSIDVNRIFAPERDRVYFPPGTIIRREKESVNGTYEEFLRGVLSETDWRGGVFDVLPGNARTNLDEGAIGYFTAAEVIRDTIRIN